MRKSDKAVLAVLGVVLGAMLAWGIGHQVHQHGEEEREEQVEAAPAVELPAGDEWTDSALWAVMAREQSFADSAEAGLLAFPVPPAFVEERRRMLDSLAAVADSAGIQAVACAVRDLDGPDSACAEVAR